MEKRRFLVFISAVTVVLIVGLVGNLLTSASCLAKELPKVNWRCQSCVMPPETTFDGQAVSSYGLAVKLVRNVKEKTNGKFNIDVFTPGAILKPMETTQGLITGVVDMAVLVGSMYTGIIPEANFSMGLPFGLPTSEDFLKMMTESNYMEIMRHAYAKHGLYFLMREAMGATTWMSSSPIYGASDLKGKKFRSGGMGAEILKRFGGIPVQVAVSEIYTALQRGTIDGCRFALYAGGNYKIYEVAKYVSKPWLCNTAVEVAANMSALDRLPQEYRDILIREANELNMWTLTVNSPKLDRLSQSNAESEYGAIFTTIPPDEWARMREIAMPYWDEWAGKSEDCAKLVEIFKKYSK